MMQVGQDVGGLGVPSLFDMLVIEVAAILHPCGGVQ
jgi:hypothetical protein